MKRIVTVLVIFSSLFLLQPLIAQNSRVLEGIRYPIPPKTTHRMFYLQRTPNANTIACDLNMVHGQLDKNKPLITYWLRYGDSPKGERKELNFIQRNFAYGLDVKKLDNDRYEFSFVSYKKYKMYLMHVDGEWKVYSKINNRLALLNSLFLYIHGGSFWNPHVEYVEIWGTDTATGKNIIGRLTDVKKEES